MSELTNGDGEMSAANTEIRYAADEERKTSKADMTAQVNYSVTVGSPRDDSPVRDETYTVLARNELDAAYTAGTQCNRIGWVVKEVRKAL